MAQGMIQNTRFLFDPSLPLASSDMKGVGDVQHKFCNTIVVSTGMSDATNMHTGAAAWTNR